MIIWDKIPAASFLTSNHHLKSNPKWDKINKINIIDFN